MGSIDNQIKMSYAIDGTNIGSVPLKSDGEIHIVSGAIGTVNLPELSEGQHTLTIRLYGISYPYHPKQYAWYVDTVQFSTYHVDGKLNQSTTPTPSPSIPEFSFVVVLSSLVIVHFILVAIKRKYPNTYN